MTILDGTIGNVIRCDRCQKIHDHENSDWSIRSTLWYDIIFNNRRKPDIHADFCRECAIEVTPLVYHLRDIDELELFINCPR